MIEWDNGVERYTAPIAVQANEPISTVQADFRRSVLHYVMVDNKR
jgi:hypothetical protein